MLAERTLHAVISDITADTFAVAFGWWWFFPVLGLGITELDDNLVTGNWQLNLKSHWCQLRISRDTKSGAFYASEQVLAILAAVLTSS
jgi:hypothetical protein